MSYSNKSKSYKYADFLKKNQIPKDVPKSHDKDDNDDVHLKYSKKHDTVTIKFGTKKVHYNLDVFIDKYIDSGENLLNLTKEQIDFFKNIRSERSRRHEKINLENKKKPQMSELEQIGIIDRASYKRWCVHNHPDKVEPDKKDEATELFKRISVLCANLS